jgi:hypothetical protein
MFQREVEARLIAQDMRDMTTGPSLCIRLGDVVAVHLNFHHPTRRTAGVWFHAEAIGGTLSAADDLVDARYCPRPPSLPRKGDNMLTGCQRASSRPRASAARSRRKGRSSARRSASSSQVWP